MHTSREPRPRLKQYDHEVRRDGQRLDKGVILESFDLDAIPLEDFGTSTDLDGGKSVSRIGSTDVLIAGERFTLQVTVTESFSHDQRTIPRMRTERWRLGHGPTESKNYTIDINYQLIPDDAEYIYEITFNPLLKKGLGINAPLSEVEVNLLYTKLCEHLQDIATERQWILHHIADDPFRESLFKQNHYSLSDGKLTRIYHTDSGVDVEEEE